MPDSKWLTDLKYTLSCEIGRLQAMGLPPRAIIERLWLVPEVPQAFHLRENRLRPLALDPSTDEERQEIVDALERVTPWLDLSEPKIAERLRAIAAALQDGGASVD